MIPYILYASLILTACFIFYKILLQKETFFNLNRFVLLTCMLLAFIIPVLRVPQQLSFRAAPVAISTAPPEVVIQPESATRLAEQQTKSVVETIQTSQVNFDRILQWLVYLYWFGVIIFGLNFLIQAVLLLYKAYTRPVIMDGKFRIVEISGDKAPCSFGNNIFINPEKYDWVTYNQVLLHEKIHIQQKHTLDLLFAEIVLIFQWFNPFAWLWRKELENNLEFFTDNKLLEHDDVEKESYQLSLLKVAAPHYPLSLTTNYNQSLLKKRLLMMNAKKSNVHTTWKYFFLLPVMVLFIALFNEPMAKSQNITLQDNSKKQVRKNHDMEKEGNWFATINGDTISIQFKNKNENKTSDSYGGTTFLLNEFRDLPRDKTGTFTLTREAGTMNFKGRFEGLTGMGQYTFIPNKSYGDEMYKEGIDVTADSDLMAFFFINIKRSYVQMLKQNGFNDLDKDRLIPLAALQVNETYIQSIREAGFANIDLENLVPFKALNVDKAYIEEIRKAGYKDVTPDRIITLKAQGIDGKYITDFRSSAKAGISKNEPENMEVKDREEDNAENEEREPNENNNENNNLNKNANHNKNRSLNNNKNKDLNKDDDDDIIAFKAMNIDAAFKNSFKEAGYNNISNDDLIAMKAIGVTAEYAKSFRSAGFSDLKPEDLVGLKAQNVTPALVQQYKALGFKNVTFEDIIGAKATGTSPSFVKSMRDKGHKLTKLDDYIALKAVLGF